MSIVAGVDFGTLSVRVSICRSASGVASAPGTARVSAASQERRSRPRHAEPRRSHAGAGRRHAQGARRLPASSGSDVEAIAIDTTGSSVIPVDAHLAAARRLLPVVRSPRLAEAAEITAAAHKQGLEAIDWCGGVYSSEWGFSKLLHWLRHNPGKRERFASALEHCDMAAAVLCGITDPEAATAQHLRHGSQVDVEPQRSAVCRRRSSSSGVDPLLAGIREKLERRLCHLRHRSPAVSRRNGRSSSVCAPAFPFRSALSTRIGTRLARAAHRRCRQRRRHLHLHHGHRRTARR